MIPVLRLFVKKENVRYITGMIIAGIVVQFFGTTFDVFTAGCGISASGFLNKFHLEPVTGYLCFLLLGWLLSNFEVKKPFRIALYFTGAAAVAVSTCAVQFGIDRIENIRDYVYEPLSLPALLYGCALFVFVSNICKNKTTEKTAVQLCSNFSFGIYVIHIAVLELFVQIILPYASFPMASPFLYIAVIYAIDFALSFVLVFLVSKLKYIKKIFYIK